MDKKRTIGDVILLFIKGIAMGTANKVPGVSGGIVAFVAGFYEEFIYSLNKFNAKALKLLFNGRFKSFYNYINGPFLWVIVAGMVFSYFSVSKLLDYFIKNYELYVWSLFFGMILGSIYYIDKDFKKWTKKNVGFGIVGLLLGISISFLTPARENDHLLFVFLCGVIGVSGMTLPGLSGSFILILLGNYVLLLVDSVNALYDSIFDVFTADFSFLHDPERIHSLSVLGMFTLGSVVGLITLSHLISYVLKRYHDVTTATIIGFITGSAAVVWPWKKTHFKTNDLGEVLLDSNGDKIIKNFERFLPDISSVETWYAVAFIILGVTILILLEKYGSQQKK